MAWHGLRQQYAGVSHSDCCGFDRCFAVRLQGAAAVFGEAGGNISTVLGLEFSDSVTGSSCTVTTGALGTCPDCKVLMGIDKVVDAVELYGCSHLAQLSQPP